MVSVQLVIFLTNFVFILMEWEQIKIQLVVAVFIWFAAHQVYSISYTPNTTGIYCLFFYFH